MQKILAKSFYVMGITAILIFAAVFIMNEQTMIKYDIDTITPTEENIMEDGSIEYVFDLSVLGANRKDICFYTSHQFVKAYADGELNYEVTEDAGIFGHTPGSFWSFVHTPQTAKKVTVVLAKAYPEGGVVDSVFYIGSSVDMYTKILRDSLVLMLASIIIIVLGVIMIVYWYVMHRRIDMIDKSMLFLGIFSIVLGLWSANETDSMVLIFREHIASYVLAFLLLMLLGVPFLQFIKEFLKIKEKKGINALNIACILNFVIVIVLQLTGTADLKQTIFITHVVLLSIMIYTVVNLVQKIRIGGVDRRVKTAIIGSACLLAATLVDIGFYYQNVGQGDFFGRFAFVIFISLFGIESTRDVEKMVELGRHANRYLEMATIDPLTGLYNRTAYESDLEQAERCNKAIIYTFDLNNLKKCNDEFGHKVGDEFIVKSAQIIEKNFGRYGKCYRIGGDEFCCLITEGFQKSVYSLIDNLCKDEDIFNKLKRLPVNIEIACGYGVYDRTRDKDFETARERADIMMYKNKGEIKGSLD